MVESNLRSTVVYVAAHKPYVMPADTSLYVPVHVGAALAAQNIEGYQPDDEGENISSKNPNYCELTAMYWAWKNSDSGAVGLAHYRRYLCSTRKRSLDSALSRAQIEALLADHDFILPKKRRYYIESNGSHYLHAHESEPLETLRNVIRENYPEYLPDFEKVLAQRSAHMFNMLIARREAFDAYASWLFDVLAKVEEQTDTSSYNAYEARVYGFLSELLLDVWISHNKRTYVERPCVYMEKQNWLLKGGQFLKRKFFPQRSGLSRE